MQPIVENVIYHGIKKKKTSGHININGNVKGNNIILKVIDDGIGMTNERIKEVFEADFSDSPNSRIGINNVNKRLKLFFGDQYSLTCKSKENENTEFIIIIPKIDGE